MGKELHVVLLPFPAFGHLMPFLQLSIALAKAKVHVSYISTPRTIQRLPKIPPELQPFIHLVPIPFPTLEPDFLPQGAESIMDIPGEKFINLDFAYDLLRTPIKQFIADEIPDWIIADFSPDWVVELAEEHGVPLAYFSVFSAATSVFYGLPDYLTIGATRNYALPPEWVTFPSLVAFNEREAKNWEFFQPLGTRMSCGSRLAKIISASQVLAVRTCDEIEGDYLEVYKKITGKPVIPTGVLPSDDQLGKKEISSDHDGCIFDWLDKQKSKSVVFVGFGSVCRLSKDQVHELAYGLELSELSFIWVLPKPPSAANNDQVDDFLPIGFVDKISERGLVCFGWVPQSKILGHQSIGGSLFHSGWGSAIEMLQFGHWLVLLPFHYDQPLNARLLVEKGLAAEVKRNEDGSFSRDEIAKALRLAMVEKEGEKLRTNARKASLVFGNQKLHQDHYISAFVDHLKNNDANKR